MLINKENYNRYKEMLENLGFSQSEAYKMLKSIEPDEEKNNARLVSDFYDGCREIVHRMCRQRCPMNEGFEKKCESCLVQHVFKVLTTQFKISAEASERHGKHPQPVFSALAWLVLKSHEPERFCW